MLPMLWLFVPSASETSYGSYSCRHQKQSLPSATRTILLHDVCAKKERSNMTCDPFLMPIEKKIFLVAKHSSKGLCRAEYGSEGESFSVGQRYPSYIAALCNTRRFLFTLWSKCRVMCKIKACQILRQTDFNTETKLLVLMGTVYFFLF